MTKISILYPQTQHHLFQHHWRFEDPMGTLQAVVEENPEQEKRNKETG
jgi:hypothetical protein